MNHSLEEPRLGISRQVAKQFLTTEITPLLVLVGFLLGIFAIIVMPREEEPQINVTFAAFKQIYNRWIKGDLKIYAIGVGEKEPIVQGNSEAAYRKNRRIEIRFGIDKRKGKR